MSSPEELDHSIGEEPPNWPALGAIGLNKTAIRERRRYVGGSDANVILGGDTGKLVELWREKTGTSTSIDLSGVLPIAMGLWTEAFNRQWYEKQTACFVTEAGSVFTSMDYPWRRATLDGLVPEKSSIWEAKHVNAFSKPEDVLARYMPQLQHNMAVVGLDGAILSVIYGNHKWEVYEVAADWSYQLELLDAEEHFWRCVTDGRAPAAVKSPTPPKILPSREVSFVGNNAWAVAAADWREHAGAAKLFADASRTIKDLIEPDMTRAWGHGIEAKQSKAGAVTIRECKA